MRRFHGLVVGALFTVVLWRSSPAHAQDAQGNTFSLELFRPAIDSKGYFNVNASQLLGHLELSFGLVGSWSRNPLELTNDANQTRFVVSDLVTAQVQAAIGLFKWAELGVSLPVHILFGRRDPSYRSTAPNQDHDLTFGAQFVGDLGLHPKIRLLEGSRHAVGLALLASLYVPTGRSSAFLGEGNVTLHPQLILDKEFGLSRRLKVALDAGVLVRFDKHTFTDRGTTLDGDPTMAMGQAFCAPSPGLVDPAPGTCGTQRSRSLGTQLTYGLALSGAVVPQKLELIVELSGYADLTGSANGNPLELLAGGKVYLASKSYFLFGAGTGLVPGQTGSPQPRLFVGFVFEPRNGDRDGDGVPDSVDRCPDEPEDRDDFEDEDGCPDPDNDRDRILDRDDQCPNDPETYNGFQDSDGCPDEFDRDRDGDRIPDRLDKCPDEPEDHDQFEDEDGCPDPDNDRDRILDVDDLCPNQPETYNGFEDGDGCPDQGRVRVGHGTLQLFDKIHFDTAKATIKPISFPILDALAATLKGNPQLTLVEVQGHADERGDDDSNLRLTEDRAQAVRRYLTEHGVAGERLAAHGYGETRPLCARHEPACWAKNRRVEFVIVRQDGGIAGQN